MMPHGLSFGMSAGQSVDISRTLTRTVQGSVRMKAASLRSRQAARPKAPTHSGKRNTALLDQNTMKPTVFAVCGLLFLHILRNVHGHSNGQSNGLSTDNPR